MSGSQAASGSSLTGILAGSGGTWASTVRLLALRLQVDAVGELLIGPLSGAQPHGLRQVIAGAEEGNVHLVSYQSRSI